MNSQLHNGASNKESVENLLRMNWDVTDALAPKDIPHSERLQNISRIIGTALLAHTAIVQVDFKKGAIVVQGSWENNIDEQDNSLECPPFFNQINSSLFALSLPSTSEQQSLTTVQEQSFLITPMKSGDNNYFIILKRQEDFDENEQKALWLIKSQVEKSIEATASQNLRHKINEIERRNDLLSENGWQGIVTISPDGVINWTNSSTPIITGIPTESMVGNTIFDFIYEEDLGLAQQTLEKLLRGPEKSVESVEIRVYRPDRSFYWVEVILTKQMEELSLKGIVINFLDIDERKNKEEMELKRAYLDENTGLPNANALQKDLGELLGIKDLDLTLIRVSTSRTSEIILYNNPFIGNVNLYNKISADLQNLLKNLFFEEKNKNRLNEQKMLMLPFSETQDTVEDNVMKSETDIAERILPDPITVYKLEGDEFAIVIRQTDEVSDITELTINAVRDVEKFFEHIPEYIATMTNTAVGYAVRPRFPNSISAREFILNAELALSEAKKNYHTPILFLPYMVAEYLENIMLQNALLYILEDTFDKTKRTNKLELDSKGNGLMVFYQPKFSYDSKRKYVLEGFEALFRWKKDGNMISPLKVITMAEEKVQIIQTLGEMVFRESCRQLKDWIQKGYTNYKIAINLSPKQISRETSDKILRIIKETGLSNTDIELELTESALAIGNNDYLISLKKLYNAGINIVIDDFGTGRSSMGRFKAIFEFFGESKNGNTKTFKIDNNLTHDITTSTIGKAIFGSILKLASELNIKIIVEGIEKEEQLLLILKLYDDSKLFKDYSSIKFQGFLLGRPMSASDIESNFLNGKYVEFYQNNYIVM